MAYRLFVDSSNGVTITPEYNFKEEGKKIENVHRVRSGAQYVYLWGSYNKWKFTVKYVNSEFKSIVNSWWETNTNLLFMEEGSSKVSTVRLSSKKLPVGKYMKPYDNEFQGVIELETY